MPKARARTVHGRSGGVNSFTPASTSEYEDRVRWRAKLAVAKLRGWPTDATAYRLSVRVYRSTRRGDLGNFVKAVEDALNPPKGAGRKAGQIVWPDDARVTDYGPTFMRTDRTNPRTEVTIEVIER